MRLPGSKITKQSIYKSRGTPEPQPGNRRPGGARPFEWLAVNERGCHSEARAGRQGRAADILACLDVLILDKLG